MWRLGALYQRNLDLGELIRPSLRRLVATTGETASFYVADGDERICLYRINSPHSLRYHLEEGQRLPIDQGAAGRVLSAYGDPPSAQGKEIREHGFYVSLGEVRGLMLTKYPHHIQAGILLPTGEWRRWRQEGVAAVAERVRRFDKIFVPFAEGLKDFTPFFPLEGVIRFVREWARDGLLLIGDAAHTMSPAGAIGVNVALATAAVAAQEIYPRLGHGPIAKADLLAVQRAREADVRTLHRLQLGAQNVLLGQQTGNAFVKWLIPRALPWLLRSPLLPRIQRRLFFGVPLPPLDPAFRFAERATAFAARE